MADICSNKHEHKAIQKALLSWFRRHRRDLPWRRTRDPYAIWVSEIMLQQTQVAMGIPYYDRWMRLFPTIESLARASEGAVLKAWEGLGYYSRARNLHRAAKIVASEYGGRLPDTAEALQALPGIGRYTAGAIASVAFGRDEPVLDCNVIRVYCRVYRVRTDPKSPVTIRRLWALAEEALPKGKASHYNQALMDLGASICVPRAPRCERCPLEAHCLARRHSEQNELPLKTPRKAVPHHVGAVGVIYRGDKVLIDQRRPKGLLGGMWEFPGGKLEEGETLEECLVREVREELDIAVRVVRPLMQVRHGYTHFRVTLHVFECRFLSGTPRPLACADFRWVTIAELDQYPFPKANRRIIDALTAQACK